MNGVAAGTDAAEIAQPAIPLGSPGRPAEIAALIGHLTAHRAAYITGTSLVIDGGLTLMSAIASQVGHGPPLTSPEGLRK